MITKNQTNNTVYNFFVEKCSANYDIACSELDIDQNRLCDIMGNDDDTHTDKALLHFVKSKLSPNHTKTEIDAMTKDVEKIRKIDVLEIARVLDVSTSQARRYKIGESGLSNNQALLLKDFLNLSPCAFDAIWLRYNTEKKGKYEVK